MFPSLPTTRRTPAHVRRREVEIAPLSDWVFDGKAETRVGSPRPERNLENLLLRDTRGGGSTIEEGSLQGEPQARNCLYESIQNMSFDVQKAFRNACQRSMGSMNFSIIYQLYSKIIKNINRDVSEQLP